MAKNPSFSFYTSDFLTETIFLSFEDRGKLITLFCLQHQLGHLTKEQIQKVCGKISAEVMKFFQLDEEGKYFCEKIDVAKNKREKFIEKQRENGSKKWKKEKFGKDLADAKVMPKENFGKDLAMPFENENEIEKEEEIENEIEEVKEKDIDKRERKKSPQAEVFEYFAKLYKNETNIDYLGKRIDYINLAKLIKKYGKALVIQKINWLLVGCKHSVFFFSRDISDFNISTLTTQWDRILPKLTEEQKREEAIRKKEEEDERRVQEELAKDKIYSKGGLDGSNNERN